MRCKFVLAGLLTAVVTAGCSGKPSDGAIADLIAESYGTVNDEPWVEVEDFERTNGMKRDDGTYVADVKFEIQFLKDFKEVGAELAKSSEGNPLAKAMLWAQIGALKMRFGEFKAGDRVSQVDRIALVKTEQGWQLAEGWDGSGGSSTNVFDD